MNGVPQIFSAARAQCARGWQVLQALLVLLVLAVTPASHAPPRREAMAEQLLRATWPHCLWFTLLATLLGVVLIRIVVVTAQSYGLSQYALEMVVRVLVLELLPLMAALFVALRWSLPTAAELARQPVPRADDAGTDWLANVALPRALAGVFSVWLLVAISCVLGLVLAYLLVYGLTPWGWAAYTHMVGRVFSPVVTLIFVLKTLAFSVAVGVVPLASLVPQVGLSGASDRRGMEVQGLVRMTGMLLAVELISLVGNYY